MAGLWPGYGQNIMMILPDSHIRPAAVAGQFYAADPQQLLTDVLQYLAAARANLSIQPKALIVPHAGYIYSGPVAASAYKLLEAVSTRIRQVILLGPSHRVALNGVATSDANFYETPLGKIKINRDFCTGAEQLSFVHQNNLAHKDEHSLEVQLPFLQTVLDDFELTPLVVGDCNSDDIASLLTLFFDADDTLFVISTDLSHFHDYATASHKDQLTSAAIEALQSDKISYDDACGRNPLNGFLTLARQKQLNIKQLDLRNSGDTAGDKNRVVGYGAYVAY